MAGSSAMSCKLKSFRTSWTAASSFSPKFWSLLEPWIICNADDEDDEECCPCSVAEDGWHRHRSTQKKGIALGAGGHICWHMKRVNKRRQNSYLDWFIRLVYTFTFTFHKTLHDCLSVGPWPTMRHKCYQPSHHLLIFSYFSVVWLVAKCYVFVTV